MIAHLAIGIAQLSNENFLQYEEETKGFLEYETNYDSVVNKTYFYAHLIIYYVYVVMLIIGVITDAYIYPFS